MNNINISYPNSTDDDQVFEATWIASVTTNATLTALSLWILFSLVHFGIKTGQWSGRQKRNADKLNAGWIYTSVVVCAVMAIIRFITSQITHNVGFSEDQMYLCEGINDALFVEYSLVLFCSYVFLWMRQRTFYTNKMLNISYSRGLRVLSGSSIFILAVSGLGVICINTIPTNYPSSSSGCHYRSNSESLDLWLWALCGVILAIGQIVLMLLLLYPLARNMDKTNCLKLSCLSSSREKNDFVLEYSNSPTIRSEPGLKNDTSKRIKKPISDHRSTKRSSGTVKKIMIRTVAFGFIALLTDTSLIVILATSILNQEDPRLRRVSVTLYDLNVFLNLMLVVMSFVTWKKILTSLCRKAATLESSSNST